MKIRTLLAIAAISLPLAAQAEFNYTYLEGGYVRLEPDRFNDSGNGIGVRGSAALSQNLFITGEFSSVEFDIGPFDADTDQYGVGLGLHMPATDRMDFVGSLSWINVDIDNFADDDGFRLDLGLRGQVTPAFELAGGIRYAEVFNDETSGYLRGLIGPNRLRLVLEVEAGDEGEAYLIGGRYDF